MIYFILKFQQNLKIEFRKEENVFNEIIFVNVNSWLDSYKEVFDDVAIDKQLDKQHSYLYWAIGN